jgi:hypothetical protein
VITVEIATAITIEIATAMVVIQTGTAMGAMTGIETGIGEIAIAAIGTAIDKLKRQLPKGPARFFECDYSTLGYHAIN